MVAGSCQKSIWDRPLPPSHQSVMTFLAAHLGLFFFARDCLFIFRSVRRPEALLLHCCSGALPDAQPRPWLSSSSLNAQRPHRDEVSHLPRTWPLSRLARAQPSSRTTWHASHLFLVFGGHDPGEVRSGRTPLRDSGRPLLDAARLFDRDCSSPAQPRCTRLPAFSL